MENNTKENGKSNGHVTSNKQNGNLKNEKMEKRVKNQLEIDGKEQELERTYDNIKQVLDSLIEAIHSSEDQDLIAQLATRAGKSVEKTAEIKQNLCDLYEQEDAAYFSLHDDNESVDEDSFASYETHYKQLKQIMTPNQEEGDTQIKPSGKSGYLSKKSRLINRWTNLYFVLEGSEMVWYSDEDSFRKVPGKPKGRIDLNRAKLLEDATSPRSSPRSSSDHSRRFCVQGGGRSFLLEAKSEQERRDWVELIVTTVEKK
eukprot:TRINITY_DN11745_c0_g1_i3.p1 TRINITY_DN11745_c0_g1~~TRINITY_DN11745_c0_g1_i3.p1  ORF type:complete len:258 (+),score=50.07 TRINITY_DN11745_c0_g1_i3:184-957(+)